MSALGQFSTKSPNRFLLNITWGNKPGTEEPVSGRYGDTSKGEPYDAGNIEPISENAGEEAIPNEAVTRRVNEDTSSDTRPTKPTATTPESNGMPGNPPTEPKTETEPSDSPKGPAGVRPPEDHKISPGSAPAGANDAPKESPESEAPKLDSPGPRPIEEVAKEHSGRAQDISAAPGGAKSGDEEGEAKGGGGDQQESKGTGEKYVKSSGVQADGGDFDAAKPGAGREAERKPSVPIYTTFNYTVPFINTIFLKGIMEEKGLRGNADPGDEGKAGGSPSGKKHIGQKIKDKLHRH
ncbi:hypothetical protein F4861DRAFT_538663 [Xylaria intraflava]|nr:hypothetical protein F4861DRAFT_538663 [Xylaria intraflava]